MLFVNHCTEIINRSLYKKQKYFFLACAIQMYFFLIFRVTECFIVTAMAYDRYIGVCNPVLYLLIMNDRLCIQLEAGCWLSGIPVHVGFSYQILSLPYCGSNKLSHFFCDTLPLLKLVCGETFMIPMLIYFLTVPVVTIFFLR